MTLKQESILFTALKLFSDQGFDATATSQIAKEAGVSEGLIFRHYKNKEGLLEAILEYGKQKVSLGYEEISKIQNPKKRIKAIIQMPFNIKKEDYHFWKLNYALKWQHSIDDDRLSASLKMALNKAFKELGHSKPKAETEAVLLLIDGIITSILLRKPPKQKEILQVILDKYDLSG